MPFYLHELFEFTFKGEYDVSFASTTALIAQEFQLRLSDSHY